MDLDSYQQAYDTRRSWKLLVTLRLLIPQLISLIPARSLVVLCFLSATDQIMKEKMDVTFKDKVGNIPQCSSHSTTKEEGNLFELINLLSHDLAYCA